VTRDSTEESDSNRTVQETEMRKLVGEMEKKKSEREKFL
jgi:hypothetical protein